MAWLMLAQAIIAASGPVAIESVEQAKAMTPHALADALLAPGHPPIDVANVAPLTMEAPPPPGAPPRFRVVLQTRPEPAEPGFCRRTAIDLLVFDPGPAARSEVRSTRTLHRLGSRCEGGKAAYGTYQDDGARRAIRDLAALQRRRRPTAQIDYFDERPVNFRTDRYADGAAALRAVPLDRIHWAGPASHGGSISDDARRHAPGEAQVGFYADGLWRGVVTMNDRRITHVYLQRSIPPPF